MYILGKSVGFFFQYEEEQESLNSLQMKFLIFFGEVPADC